MSEDRQTAIRAMIAEIVEQEPETVAPDAHIVEDLGADSMSVLELVAMLENRFGITIAPEMFPELVTVRSIAALVSTLAHERG